MLKAYMVFPGDSPQLSGCLLVFAETRGAAKTHWHYDNTEYTYIRALRKPQFDFLGENKKESFIVESNEELPDGVSFYDNSGF